MRRNVCVGILREGREHEGRAPLTPADVEWLIKRGLDVEVESSGKRVFSDDSYKKSGARVVNRFQRASLLAGIKEPQIDMLYDKKTYLLFSHTSKGQRKNMPLLKAFLEKKITLIDYEKIVDPHGRRLVFFGRFAGICGLVDTLCYAGQKLRWQGINNPFEHLKPAVGYRSLAEVKQAMAVVGKEIGKKRLRRAISPFIIGVSGHGNVSKGALEMLDLLNPLVVHPKDMAQLLRRRQRADNGIYKVVFLREERLRPKSGKSFHYEGYERRPEKYESNLDRYLQYLNIFINGSYWDRNLPMMVTKKMIRALSKRRPFRLEFIADIACDVDGSIELTHKTTTSEDPVYTYDPQKDVFVEGWRAKGVTVLAIDNLPSELPKDSSAQFSFLIRDYIWHIATNNTHKITNNQLLPTEIRRAVITEGGRLTRDFRYLKRFL